MHVETKVFFRRMTNEVMTIKLFRKERNSACRNVFNVSLLD